MYLAQANVDFFREFVKRLPYERTERWTAVSSFVHHWLQSGEAAKECRGNFSVYVQTIVLIVIEWERRSHTLDCPDADGTVVARYIERFDDEPEGSQGEWLGREEFADISYLVHRTPIADADLF